MEICGRGGRMLGGAGRTKEWNDKGRQKWRDTLDKESPIQAGCGRSACPVRRAGWGNGVTVPPLGHRQTKGAATDMCSLKPPRHISTPPKTRHSDPSPTTSALARYADNFS